MRRNISKYNNLEGKLLLKIYDVIAAEQFQAIFNLNIRIYLSSVTAKNLFAKLQ